MKTTSSIAKIGLYLLFLGSSFTAFSNEEYIQSQYAYEQARELFSTGRAKQASQSILESLAKLDEPECPIIFLEYSLSILVSLYQQGVPRQEILKILSTTENRFRQCWSNEISARIIYINKIVKNQDNFRIKNHGILPTISLQNQSTGDDMRYGALATFPSGMFAMAWIDTGSNRTLVNRKHVNKFTQSKTLGEVGAQTQGGSIGTELFAVDNYKIGSYGLGRSVIAVTDTGWSDILLGMDVLSRLDSFCINNQESAKSQIVINENLEGLESLNFVYDTNQLIILSTEIDGIAMPMVLDTGSQYTTLFRDAPIFLTPYQIANTTNLRQNVTHSQSHRVQKFSKDVHVRIHNGMSTIALKPDYLSDRDSPSDSFVGLLGVDYIQNFSKFCVDAINNRIAYKL